MPDNVLAQRGTSRADESLRQPYVERSIAIEMGDLPTTGPDGGSGCECTFPKRGVWQ